MIFGILTAYMCLKVGLPTLLAQPRVLPEGELLPEQRRKLLLLVAVVAGARAEDGGKNRRIRRILGPAAASQRVRAKGGEGAGSQRNVLLKNMMPLNMSKWNQGPLRDQVKTVRKSRHQKRSVLGRTKRRTIML